MSEIQPYKSEELNEKISVPEKIKTPKSTEQLVMVARQIYEAEREAPYKLPPEYSDLEEFFQSLYEYQYEKEKGVDVVPENLDFLYQQYGIKKDEELRRNGFNTFGLYLPSYLDGLATVRDPNNLYFGVSENPQYRKKHQALLLGCSSISSAKEFTAFIKTINPEAMPIIADLNPLAVKLSKENSEATVIQADAQRIPLNDQSVDFVATNFLVPNLVDRLGSDKGTIQEILGEIARVLTREGRLVMVEQLSRSDLDWLVYYAGQVDLGLATGGPEGGFNTKALILNNRANIGTLIEGVPNFIQLEEDQRRKKMSDNLSDKFIKKLPWVTSLVFRESRWSERAGWKKGETVVVKSSGAESG